MRHTMPRRQVWDRVLAINLTSYVAFAKHCLPAMLRPRGEKARLPCGGGGGGGGGDGGGGGGDGGGGVIVNIASVQGLQSQAGIPAYAASKGGVLSLTRQLAVE